MTRTNGSAGMPDYTRDAMRDFGTRGEMPIGRRDAIAYAWCAREGGYHLTNTRATTRIPTHGKVRLPWRMNASQRGTRKDVRVVRVGTLTELDAYLQERGLA